MDLFLKSQTLLTGNLSSPPPLNQAKKWFVNRMSRRGRWLLAAKKSMITAMVVTVTMMTSTTTTAWEIVIKLLSAELSTSSGKRRLAASRRSPRRTLRIASSSSRKETSRSSVSFTSTISTASSTTRSVMSFGHSIPPRRRSALSSTWGSEYVVLTASHRSGSMTSSRRMSPAISIPSKLPSSSRHSSRTPTLATRRSSSGSSRVSLGLTRRSSLSFATTSRMRRLSGR